MKRRIRLRVKAGWGIAAGVGLIALLGLLLLCLCSGDTEPVDVMEISRPDLIAYTDQTSGSIDALFSLAKDSGNLGYDRGRLYRMEGERSTALWGHWAVRQNLSRLAELVGPYLTVKVMCLDDCDVLIFSWHAEQRNGPGAPYWTESYLVYRPEPADTANWACGISDASWEMLTPQWVRGSIPMV